MRLSASQITESRSRAKGRKTDWTALKLIPRGAATAVPNRIGTLASSVRSGRSSRIWASQSNGGRTWPVKRLVYGLCWPRRLLQSQPGPKRHARPGQNISPFRRRSAGVPRSGSSGLSQPEQAAQRSRHHHADRENTLVANNRTKELRAVFVGQDLGEDSWKSSGYIWYCIVGSVPAENWSVQDHRR